MQDQMDYQHRLQQSNINLVDNETTAQGNVNGNLFLAKLLSSVEALDVEPIDYQTLKRHNELATQERNRQLRFKSNFSSPLLAQSDLNPSWTFQTMDLKNPSMRDPYGKADSFIKACIGQTEEQIAPNLMIIGASGSGKSHLAGAITHELLTHGCKVLFVNFNQFMFDLLDNTGNGTARRKLETMMDRTYDVLVLDDVVISKKGITDFKSERLATILKTRLNLNLSTIIIANCMMENLVDRVGEYSATAIVALRPILINLKNASYNSTIANYDVSSGKKAPQTEDSSEDDATGTITVANPGRDGQDFEQRNLHSMEDRTGSFSSGSLVDDGFGTGF